MFIKNKFQFKNVFFVITHIQNLLSIKTLYRYVPNVHIFVLYDIIIIHERECLKYSYVLIKFNSGWVLRFTITLPIVLIK